MSTVIESPNMGLSIPVVGQEPGPQYATDVNNSLTILDSHNHSIGSGVQITPSGLNINSLLLMNGNILGTIGNLQFQPQMSSSVTGSLYEIGVDLYYNDGSGNVIRITQSGSVAGASGTITGLPSGTASASYGSGVFTFEAATNTAANIDAGSYIFRNNTVGSDGITLSPPTGLAANYQLFLPLIPAQTNVMTLDTSGNMGSITYDQVGQSMTSIGADAIGASMDSTGADAVGSSMTSVGANHIVGVFTSIPSTQADIVGQSMTSTGANSVANARTRSVSNNVGVGGISISNSSNTFSTSSTSYVAVTNLSTVIATSGRPVMINIIQDFTTNPFNVGASSGWSAELQRNGTPIGVWNQGSTGVVVPAFMYIDVVGAGTYTYSFFVKTNSANLAFEFTRLSAYEL